MERNLKGGDQHRVTQLRNSTPLSDFVAKAGTEGYRCMVTAPNRRGIQSVVVIDPELIEVHLRSAASGEATPSTPGEVASYTLKGEMVEPRRGGRTLAFFDV